MQLDDGNVAEQRHYEDLPVEQKALLLLLWDSKGSNMSDSCTLHPYLTQTSRFFVLHSVEGSVYDKHFKQTEERRLLALAEVQFSENSNTQIHRQLHKSAHSTHNAFQARVAHACARPAARSHWSRTKSPELMRDTCDCGRVDGH